MNAPIVLSHRSAWMLLHAPHREAVAASGEDFGIGEAGITVAVREARVRRALVACGISEANIGVIDHLVGLPFERTHARGFRAHAHGGVLGSENVVQVAPGLLCVTPELCFLQAGTWMSYFELVEFGFELCGGYEMPLQIGAAYRERPALTSRAALLATVDARSSARGSRLCRRALARIRDGSRSPMETATAMSLIMDRRDGGLGCRKIELNHRIDVPSELGSLASSAYFEIDVFSPPAKTGIEYDGGAHGRDMRHAHDVERMAVLTALGIRMHTLTKLQFSEQLRFHRAINAIARSLGAAPATSAEFQRAQNELRLFTIRHWAK